MWSVCTTKSIDACTATCGHTLTSLEGVIWGIRVWGLGSKLLKGGYIGDEGLGFGSNLLRGGYVGDEGLGSKLHERWFHRGLYR